MQKHLIGILEQVKSGNKMAFKYLVEEHQQFAFSLAFRVLCNEEDAKDVVQESFIKIWKNINSYNAEFKFTTWMYKIVVNTALDNLKTSKRPGMVNLDAIPDHLKCLERDGPEAKCNNSMLGNLIAGISGELPEKQRMVFVLRDLQGFDSDEVETILDMNESSVKSNLYHARQLIRKKLEKIWEMERGT